MPYTTYNCDALTGGAARALDSYSVGALTTGDRAFVDEAGETLRFKYNSAGTAAENVSTHPYVVRPDDYSDGGNWEEQETVGNVSAAANLTANALIVGDDGAKGVKAQAGTFCPDYNEADQGLTGSGKSAKAYIDAIAADSATIVFRHSSSAATTTYTFSTDETIPANINVIIEKGAILSIGNAITLTINGSLSAGIYQIFSGDGNVSGLREAYPEWWYASGVYTTAIQKASTAARKVWFTGDYTIGAEIVPISNRSYIGQGKPSITTTANADIFAAAGAKTAHLTNITFKGIKFIGKQAAFSNYGIDIRWVDYLTVEGCEFQDIHMVYAAELDGDAFADIAIGQIAKHITIRGNQQYCTLASGTSAPIFIRFAKEIDISGNIMVGLTANAGGAGIEVYGGNCQIADNAAALIPGSAEWTTDRKCVSASIVGNTLRNYTSGINIAQCRRVTASGNTLTDCGECLWVGSSLDIALSGNTVSGDSNALQTQGANGNILFDGNVVNTSSAAGAILLGGGGAYTTEYNVGPIAITNNIINSSVGNDGAVYTVGHLIIKGNTFYNVQLMIYGKVAQLEIENNSFTYDLFTATATLLRLSQYNATIAGFTAPASPTTVQCYTKIKNNTWEDRTLVATQITIYIYDPAKTSYLEVTANTFITAAGTNNIVLATNSGAITLTTRIRNNYFGGIITLGALNTATISHVIWQDNYSLAGWDYIAAVPADADRHYFSHGSRVMSNNPAGDGFIGWVCIVEGKPGTWKTFGAVTP